MIHGVKSVRMDNNLTAVLVAVGDALMAKRMVQHQEELVTITQRAISMGTKIVTMMQGQPLTITQRAISMGTKIVTTKGRVLEHAKTSFPARAAINCIIALIIRAVAGAIAAK